MPDITALLKASAERHHDHLCPRQVLGVRIGLYAGELFGFALPSLDKRLFAFVETDGCLTDGIAVVTGCWWGNRTMRLVDYGKSAATFVDMQTENAIRISPSLESRGRALDYAPNASDRWHAQLAAYQVMPTAELLQAHHVILTVSLKEIISCHGGRVICAECGEDIINEREMRRDGVTLCRACASGAYYSTVGLDGPQRVAEGLTTRKRVGTSGDY
ncbi:MAG: FmdE family protein [Acidobacteriota bacterium]